MSDELTEDELTRVICAVRNHADVSRSYEIVPRCYTPCGWVGLLETAPNGGPRKEQFAAHWQEQVANELRPIIAAHVRRALEDAADALQRPAGVDWARVPEDEYDNGIAEWLRARAAAVAPRETKD